MNMKEESAIKIGSRMIMIFHMQILMNFSQVDVRKRTKEPVASVLRGHRIHRIVVHRRLQKTPVRFAVCGDSTAVRVFDVEDNSRFIQRYRLQLHFV